MKVTHRLDESDFGPWGYNCVFRASYGDFLTIYGQWLWPQSRNQHNTASGIVQACCRGFSRLPGPVFIYRHSEHVNRSARGPVTAWHELIHMLSRTETKPVYSAINFLAKWCDKNLVPGKRRRTASRTVLYVASDAFLQPIKTWSSESRTSGSGISKGPSLGFLNTETTSSSRCLLSRVAVDISCMNCWARECETQPVLIVLIIVAVNNILVVIILVVIITLV